MSDKTSKQKGNAVFLILIGVALVAALIFAITRGSGSGKKMDNKEREILYASELMSYANSIKLIVEEMRMLKGVSDLNDNNYGVLFSAPKASEDYGIYGSQPKTEVFNPHGGKVEYQIPNVNACVSADACVYEFTGQINIKGMGRDDKSELSLVLAGITKEVCNQINKATGNDWSSIPVAEGLVLDRFSGENYGDLTGKEMKLSGVNSELDGRPSFCYQEDGGALRYVFVHIINAR